MPLVWCSQMLPAGMPELECLDDIGYLLDKLNLEVRACSWRLRAHRGTRRSAPRVLLAARPVVTLLSKRSILRTHVVAAAVAQMNDEQATAAFKEEITNSLQTVSRQFDNMIHQAKHKL